jgi:hypothetical protein
VDEKILASPNKIQTGKENMWLMELVLEPNGAENVGKTTKNVWGMKLNFGWKNAYNQ